MMKWQNDEIMKLWRNDKIFFKVYSILNPAHQVETLVTPCSSPTFLHFASYIQLGCHTSRKAMLDVHKLIGCAFNNSVIGVLLQENSCPTDIEMAGHKNAVTTF